MGETVGTDDATARAAGSRAAALEVAPAELSAHDWPFEFRGTSAEYFRIWIVNLALSIVTLGVFSAWAKVRRERYFYGNTWVAGAPFEYLADPINILKGRIVAVAVFGLYVVLQQTMPLAQAVLLLLVLIATPWVITSALRFRARYSAWNTATFRFVGTVQTAVKYYLLLGILFVPTAGLIYPYLRAQQRRFMIDGHRFGGRSFVFGAATRRFYAIFGVALLIGIATAAVAVLLGWAIVASLMGLAVKLGAAVSESWFRATTYSTIIAMYVGFFVAYVYVAARSTNLSYGATRFGSHGFRSTIRMRDLLAIYLSNTVAIVASVGLLAPWAQIRLARYRADHLTLCAHGDVHDLALEAGAERNAFGAETANVFDLDISL